MKRNYFIMTTLLLFLLSCDNNINKFYYDSGELWYETSLIDKQKQTYHCTVYYKNGIIKSEGMVLEDGTQDKEWKEYFSDGVLKWSGFIDKGNYVINKNREIPDLIYLPTKLEIEKMPEELKVGETYKIRTFVEGIHPTVYKVLVNAPNEILKNSEDFDRFPYLIIPRKIGKMYITLVFPDKQGHMILGSDMNLSFVCEVIE